MPEHSKPTFEDYRGSLEEHEVEVGQTVAGGQAPRKGLLLWLDRRLASLRSLPVPSGRRPCPARDAQQYRASGLNLVIAAIVWWNSTYMADAVDHLRAAGQPAPDDLLAHTSPVGWEHIAFSGDFLWDHAATLPTGRRQLTIGRRMRGAA